MLGKKKSYFHLRPLTNEPNAFRINAPFWKCEAIPILFRSEAFYPTFSNRFNYEHSSSSNAMILHFLFNSFQHRLHPFNRRSHPPTGGSHDDDASRSRDGG